MELYRKGIHRTPKSYICAPVVPNMRNVFVVRRHFSLRWFNVVLVNSIR